jgi:hypothetical protein
MSGMISRATWMEALLPIIGNKPFREIAIPGTHDAGTYAITSSSEVNDEFLERSPIRLDSLNVERGSGTQLGCRA